MFQPYSVDRGAIERRKAIRYWPLQPMNAAIESRTRRFIGVLINFSESGFLLRTNTFVSGIFVGEKVAVEFMAGGRLQKAEAVLVRAGGRLVAVRFISSPLSNIRLAASVADAGGVMVEAGKLAVYGTFNFHVLRELLAYLREGKAEVDLSQVARFRVGNTDFLTKVRHAGGRVVNCSSEVFLAADSSLSCYRCGGCSRSIECLSVAELRKRRNVLDGTLPVFAIRG